MLCEANQVYSSSSVMKLLILHLGTCPDLKAQVHFTKLCIIKRPVCASAEGILEGRTYLTVLLHYVRFIFSNIFVVKIRHKAISSHMLFCTK